jgi:hypothetical protein
MSITGRSIGEIMNTRGRGFWRWLDSPKGQQQLRAIALTVLAALLFYFYHSWRG